MTRVVIRPRDYLRFIDAIGAKNLRKIAKKSGSTALRDMKREASKVVRQTKKIRGDVVRKSITSSSEGADLSTFRWIVKASGKKVPLVKYSNVRRKKGIAVQVNTAGSRRVIPGSFISTMPSGHRGIFLRKFRKRALPIIEQFGSTVAMALQKSGNKSRVAERGRKSFAATFARLLRLELVR